MDINQIRKDFPILRQSFKVLGRKTKRKIAYLDHAASTHPCNQVLKAHNKFLACYYANIHRGNHNLSFIASDLFDQVPDVIASFIGADLANNTILMTNNTTSALDMASYMMKDIPGDYLLTRMEHHSNDLPHRRNGKVHYVDLLPDGSLDIEDAKNKLQNLPIKLLAVSGASNVTGFMPNIHLLASLAHENSAQILVDAAQLLAHFPLDVKKDSDPEHIDFLAAAGHKAYAPFGSAFLFAPKSIVDNVPPYIPGGGTISYVSLDEAVWVNSPERHEGGTPNIAGAIAFAQSLKYLANIGMKEIREHEKELLDFALSELSLIKNLSLYGPKDTSKRLGVISFNIEGISHELVSAILNNEAAIATRNGCFCAHPYLHFLLKVANPADYKDSAIAGKRTELPGAVRASIGIYNNKSDIIRLINTLKKISNKKWIGNYNIEKNDYCKPVVVKLVS